ncbi:MAG: hypothetical protein HeimC3_35480 [Candidatus Heimdallarchaeota archaeon LC_3]|nr:MAG: hypothetical protein HeimC3_35480 [Candidatus Heimdallarchaeota archaeon LC_3]
MGEFLMSIEMQLSGFLFLLIIIILIFCDALLGHGTIDNLKSEAKLQKINEDPKKFEISFVLLTTEHITIVVLAVMLFMAFSSFNVILGVIWFIFRGGEGLLNIYGKKNYWGLSNLARQYSNASGAEKNELIDLGSSILKTKTSLFAITQIMFSIGTLAYSILFVTYETAVPVIVGWFGIVASITYGLGNGIQLVKPNLKALWQVGGLLVLIFELVLGTWLLFLS